MLPRLSTKGMPLDHDHHLGGITWPPVVECCLTTGLARYFSTATATAGMAWASSLSECPSGTSMRSRSPDHDRRAAAFITHVERGDTFCLDEANENGIHS